MAWKYVSKEYIIQWVHLQRPDLGTGDIPDLIMEEAHAKTESMLIRGRVRTIPTTNDMYNFLKSATTCIAIALLCKAGVLTQTSGEILENRFAEVAYKFQRTNPLFFFARGSSRPFMELLPYETLRMLAYSYIRSYIQWKFKTRTGSHFPKAKVTRDNSSRGAYWNIDSDDSDVADSEFGETLPEYGDGLNRRFEDD